jgi:lipoprotein-releasing system permease protein
MYQFLLTARYLLSRLTPFLAVAAVALCVALVIVVVSVMSGFLNMVRSSGQTLMGDVIVSYPVRGIPWYGQFIDLLEANDDIHAATPVIDTWGLLRMPYPEGDSKENERVQIWGIEPIGFAKVTGFGEAVKWADIPPASLPHLVDDALAANGDAVLAALDGAARGRLLSATAADQVVDMSTAQIEHLAQSLEDGAWPLRIRMVATDGTDALEAALGAQAWAALIQADARLAGGGRAGQDGLTLQRDGRPAMVTGIHVSQANRRDSKGQTIIARDGYWWLPRFELTLTTLPIDARGGLLEPESIALPVANEFSSGVYLVDKTRVLLPLDMVQDLTHLDAAELVDPDDPTVLLGSDPARATMVLVRGVQGTTPDALRETVRELYMDFERAMAGSQSPPPILDLSPSLGIRTWEEQNASLIGPVEKERELMRTLFSIIYLVCGALIVAIFWAIVYEKTRDIGILRSIGAPRSGIVNIFLLYGLAVGVLGSTLGVGLGWLITSNINVIHDALGDPPAWPGWLLIVVGVALLVAGIAVSHRQQILPVLLGSFALLACAGAGVGLLLLRQAGGVVIWDPAVYLFDQAPNTVDWPAAWWTALGAVVVSVIAASIPAAHAADIDPVKALRYE